MRPLPTKQLAKLGLALVTGLALLGAWTAPATAQGVELRFGHVATTDNPYHLAALRFAELVAKRTDDKIKVTIFPNAQLGNERDLVEGLQLGTLNMAISANAPLSRYTEKVLLFDLPFLFRDNAHWDAVVDGPLGAQVMQEFNQHGFRAVGVFDGGWRSPYNSRRPITALDDIQGLKFRTMESPMHIAIYRALGAMGVPMASSEQYSALEQGVVDGSDAPLTFYSQLKHYEVAKNLSPLPLFKLTVYLLISEKSYESLTPEQQKIVDEAGKEAAAYAREKAREQEAKLKDQLKGEGVSVSKLKDGELERFVDVMRKTVWKEYEDKVGAENIERVLKVQ